MRQREIQISRFGRHFSMAAPAGGRYAGQKRKRRETEREKKTSDSEENKIKRRLQKRRKNEEILSPPSLSRSCLSQDSGSRNLSMPSIHSPHQSVLRQVLVKLGGRHCFTQGAPSSSRVWLKSWSSVTPVVVKATSRLCLLLALAMPSVTARVQQSWPA